MTKPLPCRRVGLLAALAFIAIAQTAALANENQAAQVATAHHRGSHSRHDSRLATAVETGSAQQVDYLQIGYASYYGARHHGHATASGERFDQAQMTAAHPWLPFGTRVLVTDRSTGRQVIVTITDRLGTQRRLIDLSLGAARELGMIARGVTSVELTPL